jgi:hypothetical protein
MQELIETIRAAVASEASNEQKAAGATACRTILTALDTEPGKPLAFPGAASTQAVSRVPVDQVLDLVIARLSMIAKEREDHQALPAPSTEAPALPAASRGLRVPMAATSALKVPPRSASTARAVPPKARPARAANVARPVPPKAASRPANVRVVPARKP